MLGCNMPMSLTELDRRVRDLESVSRDVDARFETVESELISSKDGRAIREKIDPNLEGDDTAFEADGNPGDVYTEFTNISNIRPSPALAASTEPYPWKVYITSATTAMLLHYNPLDNADYLPMAIVKGVTILSNSIADFGAFGAVDGEIDTSAQPGDTVYVWVAEDLTAAPASALTLNLGAAWPSLSEATNELWPICILSISGGSITGWVQLQLGTFHDMKNA